MSLHFIICDLTHIYSSNYRRIVFLKRANTFFSEGLSAQPNTLG